MFGIGHLDKLGFDLIEEEAEKNANVLIEKLMTIGE